MTFSDLQRHFTPIANFCTVPWATTVDPITAVRMQWPRQPWQTLHLQPCRLIMNYSVNKLSLSLALSLSAISGWRVELLMLLARNLSAVAEFPVSYATAIFLWTKRFHGNIIMHADGRRRLALAEGPCYMVWGQTSSVGTKGKVPVGSLEAKSSGSWSTITIKIKCYIDFLVDDISWDTIATVVHCVVCVRFLYYCCMECVTEIHRVSLT